MCVCVCVCMCVVGALGLGEVPTASPTRDMDSRGSKTHRAPRKVGVWGRMCVCVGVGVCVCVCVWRVWCGVCGCVYLNPVSGAQHCQMGHAEVSYQRLQMIVF